MADELGDEKCRSRCKAAGDDRLQAALEWVDAREAALHVAEYRQGQQRNAYRAPQSGLHAGEQDIRRKGNLSSDDVGHRDGESADARPGGLRFFQAKSESHHEINPDFLVSGNRFHHR